MWKAEGIGNGQRAENGDDSLVAIDRDVPVFLHGDGVGKSEVRGRGQSSSRTTATRQDFPRISCFAASSAAHRSAE